MKGRQWLKIDRRDGTNNADKLELHTCISIDSMIASMPGGRTNERSPLRRVLHAFFEIIINSIIVDGAVNTFILALAYYFEVHISIALEIIFVFTSSSLLFPPPPSP